MTKAPIDLEKLKRIKVENFIEGFCSESDFVFKSLPDLIELLEEAISLNKRYVDRFDTVDLTMKPPTQASTSIRLALEAMEWLNRFKEGRKE